MGNNIVGWCGQRVNLGGRQPHHLKGREIDLASKVVHFRGENRGEYSTGKVRTRGSRMRPGSREKGRTRTIEMRKNLSNASGTHGVWGRLGPRKVRENLENVKGGKSRQSVVGSGGPC